MKKLLIIFLISNVFIFTCCKNSDRKTEEFIKFFRSNFGVAPENGNIYLLIPSTQCKNCIILDGKSLPFELNNKLHVISALPKKHFRHFENFHQDQEDDVSALKVVDYENKLLFFDNNSIQHVFKVRLNSEASVECTRE